MQKIKIPSCRPQDGSEPLLSIIVPTRNRYATLGVIVEQFLSWGTNDFELIIEDNSDDSGPFSSVLEKYGADPRLRYRHESKPLAATENCDAAVARATGKVLTFIGDDDSVTRHCLEAAKWMVECDIEALVCGVAAYTWPDMEHAIAINNAYNGKLAAFEAAAKTRRVDVASELDHLARSGAQTMRKVPRLYQALVQRVVLDRLKADIGTYFPGPVPDMANAVSLSSHVRNCYHTEVPLVVAGQSKNSMSGKNSVRKHQGDLLLEQSLPENTAEHWDPRIPRFWSAPTIWAEAAIKGAQATQQGRFLRRFSFARVYANCFAFNDRIYYPVILDAMREHGRQNGAVTMVLLVPHVAWLVGLKTAERAFNLLKKFVFGIPGRTFSNVADATRYVESLIDEQQLMTGLMQSHANAEK